MRQRRSGFSPSAQRHDWGSSNYWMRGGSSFSRCGSRMNEPLPESSCPESRCSERIDRRDARYPAELEDLRENAPSHLWMRGSLEVLAVKPRVAIVGTRRATAYGQRVTRELTSALVRAGACIVSGLAPGIGGPAHRAALHAGGSPTAGLGTRLAPAFPLSP